MELHQVRYFLSVCQHKNFTKAAQDCHVSQPALTRAIHKLEAEMGSALFRRERAKTHLTELGRLLYPQFQKLYDETQHIQNTCDAWQKLDTAQLKLGVMCSIAPTKTVTLLRSLRNDISDLELLLSDATAYELLDKLENGEIDCALLALPDFPEEMVVLPLFKERYVIAFYQGHPFEKEIAVNVNDIRHYDYMSRLNCESLSYMSSLDINLEGLLNVKYASEREDWIQAMILAGYGIAIMPEYMKRLEGILSRPLIAPEIYRTVSLVYRAGRQHSPAMKHLINLCGQIFNMKTTE